MPSFTWADSSGFIAVAVNAFESLTVPLLLGCKGTAKTTADDADSMDGELLGLSGG